LSTAETSSQRLGLGVDIGGTGVKAALVDLDTGRIVGERVRAATPKPATFSSLTKCVKKISKPLMEQAGELEAIGVGFPAVVRRGVALSAVNVSPEWMYADVGKVFSEAFERPVWALNDSDAAAFAEARFGAGRHQGGTMLVATLGTGVGTGLIVEGQLVPNIELGCLSVRGKPAGLRVANSVRRRKKLSWSEWAADLQEFIDMLDEAVAPDVVIIGGGVSADAHRYLPQIRTRPMVVPARLRNDAGVVGAAAYAADQQLRRAQSTSGTISQLAPTVHPALENTEVPRGAEGHELEPTPLRGAS
jgi:polyphosphate glucokinase